MVEPRLSGSEASFHHSQLPKPSRSAGLRSFLFGLHARPRPLKLKKVKPSAKCNQYLSSLGVPVAEMDRVTPVFERESDMTIADFVKKRQKVLFDQQSADSADGVYETFVLDESNELSSGSAGASPPEGDGSGRDKHVTYGSVSVLRFRGLVPPLPRRKQQYNPYLDDRIGVDYPELVGAPMRHTIMSAEDDSQKETSVTGERRGLFPSPSMKFADDDDATPCGVRPLPGEKLSKGQTKNNQQQERCLPEEDTAMEQETVSASSYISNASPSRTKYFRNISSGTNRSKPETEPTSVFEVKEDEIKKSTVTKFCTESNSVNDAECHDPTHPDIKMSGESSSAHALKKAVGRHASSNHPNCGSSEANGDLVAVELSDGYTNECMTDIRLGNASGSDAPHLVDVDYNMKHVVLKPAEPTNPKGDAVNSLTPPVPSSAQSYDQETARDSDEVCDMCDETNELEDSAYMSRSDELLEKHAQKVLASGISGSFSSLARRAGSIPSSLDQSSGARLSSTADAEELICRSEEVLPRFRTEDDTTAPENQTKQASALLKRYGTSCNLVSDVSRGSVPCQRTGGRPSGQLVAKTKTLFETKTFGSSATCDLPVDPSTSRVRNLTALWEAGGSPCPPWELPMADSSPSPVTPSSRLMSSGSLATSASASDLDWRSSELEDATLAPSSGDSQSSLQMPELEEEVVLDLIPEVTEPAFWAARTAERSLPLSDIEEITEEMDGFISGSDMLSPISEDVPQEISERVTKREGCTEDQAESSANLMQRTQATPGNFIQAQAKAWNNIECIGFNNNFQKSMSGERFNTFASQTPANSGGDIHTENQIETQEKTTVNAANLLAANDATPRLHDTKIKSEAVTVTGAKAEPDLCSSASDFLMAKQISSSPSVEQALDIITQSFCGIGEPDDVTDMENNYQVPPSKLISNLEPTPTETEGSISLKHDDPENKQVSISGPPAPIDFFSGPLALVLSHLVVKSSRIRRAHDERK